MFTLCKEHEYGGDVGATAAPHALKVAVNLDPNYDSSGIQHLYRRSEVFNGHLRCMLTLVLVYMHSGMAEEAGGWPGSVTVCIAMCICIQR